MLYRSKRDRRAQDVNTVSLEWNARFERIAKLPTAVEQALAYKKLGLSPVPLIPGKKSAACKAYPALSVIQLSDEEIERLFKKRGTCVGMVGGFGGFFSIDNDEEDEAKCAKIERLQCELLSVPYARWKGRKGYKALYQDSRWTEPPTALTNAAREYLDCGFALTEAERKRAPAKALEEEFAELKADFDEKLNAFIEARGLVSSAGAPIEIKSFRLITVLPPSIHPETGEAYRVTPIAAGHHAAGLDGENEPWPIAAADVNQFLEDLRPADTKGGKGRRAGSTGKAAYVDYTRRAFGPEWQTMALDEVLKVKPELTTFTDADHVDDDNRSPAVASLLGKLVQGMMQLRKCDADKLGVFADVAKQLAELADEFIDRFPDRTAAISGCVEDHDKGWREKLGYEAGRALQNAIASDFNLYIPGREQRPGDTPQIRMRAGELHVQVKLAMENLVGARVPFFQRGGRLVRPVMEEGKDALGRVTRTAAFTEIDLAYMRHALNAHMEWFKWKEREKDWVQTRAPEDVAQTLLSFRGEWLFKSVTGILSCPTLRPDGSLLDRTGYDEQTGLYLLSTVALSDMPAKPSKKDAEAALKRVRQLYEEFPFVDDASESVGISALITAVCRGVADLVPAHGARAPVYGSGKSYLFDIASTAVNGCRCPVLSTGRDEAEMEKRLAAKAIAGSTIICIDNVNGELAGDFLAQLTERPLLDVRILGEHRIATITNRCMVFYNGNNVRPRGDMVRRTVLADLDPGMAHPSERVFKRDPVAMVLANRGQYVADCLTIVRAYFEADRPKAVDTRMNSFNAWSDSVRSALVWLGLADPCKTVKYVREDDPETQRLRALLAAAADIFGVGQKNRWTTRELAEKALERQGSGGKNGRVSSDEPAHPGLDDALSDFIKGGSVNTKGVGRLLQGLKQRIEDGLYLDAHTDKKRKIQMWYVEEAACG